MADEQERQPKTSGSVWGVAAKPSTAAALDTIASRLGESRSEVLRRLVEYLAQDGVAQAIEIPEKRSTRLTWLVKEPATFKRAEQNITALKGRTWADALEWLLADDGRLPEDLRAESQPLPE